MDILTAVSSCFANYVNFSGRAPRSEYWFFVLFVVIAAAIAVALDSALFPTVLFSPLYSIVSVVTILPWIAVTARRLHDIDRSGWWQLISFVPLIGAIVLLVWLVKRGTPGPNRFGPDPLAAMAPAVA